MENFEIKKEQVERMKSFGWGGLKEFIFLHYTKSF